MIEMLAVLAIIGVLSVIAVTGLMWAFAKYKANNTIHDVHLWELAALDSQQLYSMTSGELVLNELGEVSTHGYPIAIMVQDENVFYISVDDVPKRVCSLTLDMVEEPMIVTVNGTSYTGSDICDADTNQMLFYYNKYMGDVDNSCIPACPSGETCCGGVCKQIETPCGSNGCLDCGSKYCTNSNTCCDNPNATKCGSNDCCEGNCCNGTCCPSGQVCGSDGNCSCQNDMVLNPDTGLCECPENYMLCQDSCYPPCDNDQVWQEETCQCICKGLKEYDEELNKCVCKNLPTGGNPDTCECDEGYDLVNGACIEECPDAVGMTGLRNNAGQCLCNTSLGYEEISIENTWCNCDNSRYYWNKPDGSCMTCVQTTKEWARAQFGDSSIVNRTDPSKDNYLIPMYNVDSESVDEEGWYCGFHYAQMMGQRYFYNPSTQEYCKPMEILKRDSSGKFYCSSDCGAEHGTREYGARGGSWGCCGCGQYLLWVNNRCTSLCANGYTNYNGDCLTCLNNQVSYNKSSCLDGVNLCANYYGVSYNEAGWLYEEWLSHTPSSCHASTGYSVQTSSGECAWYHGCYKVEGPLPSCNYNDKITSACVCPTGGKEGEYCCSLAQIRTDSGCQTCTGNMIPNAERTECVACLDNEIPTSDKTACQPCPDGQIPNVTKTKCYACPDGKTPDASGTACI